MNTIRLNKTTYVRQRVDRPYCTDCALALGPTRSGRLCQAYAVTHEYAPPCYPPAGAAQDRHRYILVPYVDEEEQNL